MNVLFEGRINVHVKFEDIVIIITIFFVIIFMKLLNQEKNKTKQNKKKQTSQSMSFWRDQKKKNEMIIYCKKCKGSLRDLFFYLAPRSELYFNKVKKCLTQYKPC